VISLAAMAAVQGGQARQSDGLLVGWRRARWAWHRAVELGAVAGAREEAWKSWYDTS